MVAESWSVKVKLKPLRIKYFLLASLGFNEYKEDLISFFLLDPRLEGWPLMSSPFPTTFIIGTYIYFVTSLGPKLKENKKPFELRHIMAFYNFSVVILSLYMTYEVSIILFAT